MASVQTGSRSLALALRQLPASALLTLTGLASVDGTVFTLAASGFLSTPAGAAITGLTIIAGVGAWLAARAEYAGRRLDAADIATLGAIALVTSASAVLAAMMGARLAGSSITLVVLPKATGIVLLLLALDAGGLPVPRLWRVPLPPIVIAAAGAIEGVVQWMR